MEVAELVQYVQSGKVPLPNLTSIVIWFATLVWLVVAGNVLPGKLIKGQPLKYDKTQRLTYKINGLVLYLSSIVIFLAFSDFGLNFYPATIVYDNYAPLFVMSLIHVLVLSVYLYVRAIPRNETLLTFPLNFWSGVELNPHFLGINLKYFSYRPAFVFMAFINFSILAKHYVVNDNSISLPMILYQLISFAYAFDYFFVESYIVSTWDIIEENFGFMLVFGDYFWMPFVFSTAGPYLIYSTNDDISTVHAVACVATFLLGYTIFRGANSQKHHFRSNPDGLIWGKKPEVIKTSTGSSLLVSGWWGMARKINYLGDILIAISFSLPAGFSYFMPWAYPTYLTLLLLHRAWRDDVKCRTKYKSSWEVYCKRVRWVMIPGLF